MFGRSKWLIIIPAIILIPILLGMMPLNFIHKLGSGCPFAHEKQVLKCNPGLFHSLISHGDHSIGIPSSTPAGQHLTPSSFPLGLNPESVPSIGLSEFVPLRC